MFYRHVFDKISTEFHGILRVFVNFAGFTGFTWISWLHDRAKYQKPCYDWLGVIKAISRGFRGWPKPQTTHENSLAPRVPSPKITTIFCTSNTHQAFVWVCIIFCSNITQNSTDKDLPGDKKHTFLKRPRLSLHEMKRYTMTNQQIQVQLLFWAVCATS